MATLQEQQYALMAANAYAVKEDVTSKVNAIPIPKDWSLLDFRQNDDIGFTARAYESGNEIVIAYTGTTEEGGWLAAKKDWVYGNVAGTGAVLAPQVVDAAMFYLDILSNPLYAGRKISFTGHSLGGGLASLMAVYFDREATVFDEAPFEKSADAGWVVHTLKQVLALRGYSLPDAFKNYVVSDLFGNEVPSPTRVVREINVTSIYVKDEVLSLLQTTGGQIALELIGSLNPGLKLLATNVSNIAGIEETIDLKATSGNGWGYKMLNGDPVDLHSMALLTAVMLSVEFRNACENNPELLQQIFTSGKNVDADKRDYSFLNLMVRRDYAGEGALGMFSQDVAALEGDFAVGKLKSTLVGLAVDLHYAQGANRERGIETGAFERTFEAVDGGIQIEKRSIDKQWVESGFRRLDDELAKIYPDISAHIPALVDRYTLSDGNSLDIEAAADGKFDFMLGSKSSDNLSGSDGNDTLLGRAGADNLNGGSGWDVLVGGEGADVMNGGSGRDRYVIEGSDTVEDSDGEGILTDKSGRHISGMLQKREDGTYISQSDSITSASGSNDLTLTLTDGSSVTIKNYQDGDLGIQLFEEEALSTQFDLTLVGDLKDKDFSAASGIQSQKDEWGNTIRDETQSDPGRADGFHDSTGNDLIKGLGGNDYIFSWRGGDDQIEGGDGNDHMVGGMGKDIVIGGAGRDVIVEGGDDDKLYADSVVTLEAAIAAQNGASTGQQGEALSGSAGDDLAIGGAGNDVLFGGTGDDILVAGAGNDDIDGDAMAGNIMPDWTTQRKTTATAAGTSYSILYNQFNMEWPTEGGDDVIYAGAGEDWVMAGYGNDYVDGGNDADKLWGEGGNDDVFGGAGNDLINGDNARISVAEHGDDYLDGEEGDDQIFGEGGSDLLFGGAGNDKLYADNADGSGAGNDYLDGEAGNDELLGGALDDELYGGDGDDVLQGDSGTGSNDGDDYLDGEAGNDTLLGEGGQDEIHGGDGADQIAGDNGGEDTSGEADTIYGGAGNDLIDGQGGDDIIDGGADNDLITGNVGNDLILGGDGDDQLQGGEGDDVLEGGTGTDILFGESGNDVLRGGDDTDHLIGGEGDDILDGGAGDDVYYYQLGEGNDHIVDSGGTDWLVFEDVNWGQITLGVGSLKLNLPDGSELHLDDFDADNPYAAGGIEYFQFADGSVLTKNQLINALGIQPTGTPEADILSGTALTETIHALAGDDVVTARAGNDTVYAEDGADVVYGGDGNDIVYGGNGDDVLLGEAGNDTLYGEAGNDLLSGGAGTDILQGGEGDDTYLFQTGDGQDTATDTLGSNAIVLGSGLTLDAVVFTRQSNDLLVAAKNSTDRLTVKNWFAADSRFTSLTLGDGTTLDHAGVEAAMPRNQAPVATQDTATVVEDGTTTVAGNALANDNDPEGRTLRITNAGTYAGAVGTLSLGSAGAYSYTLANGSQAVQSLAAGQSLTETFAYTVTDDDPNGAASTSSSIRITVQGSNDLPTLGADSATTSEEAGSISGNVLNNDTDIDAGTTLTVANAGQRTGAYGSLTLGSTGAWSYSLANASAAVQSLAAGQTVTDNFSFNVSDGVAQVGGSLSVRITGQNDAPIVVTPLADQSASANSSWTWQLPAGSFADVDAGDALSYTATLADGTALPSWLGFDAAMQTFSGRVPKSATGSIELRIAATDRQGAAAADVFTLSFAAGTGGGGGGNTGGNNGGGSQGNEGVGNGVDGPPPGHDASFNDGAGTSPGNPGAEGGNGYVPPKRADLLLQDVRIDGRRMAEAAAGNERGNSADAHAGAPGQVKQDGAAPADAPLTTADNGQTGNGKPQAQETTTADAATTDPSATPKWLQEAAWAYLDTRGSDASYTATGSGGDTVASFMQWLAVQQALADQGRNGLPDWLDASKGADTSGMLLSDSRFLGKNIATGNDPLSLQAATALKSFSGFGNGLQKIG